MNMVVVDGLLQYPEIDRLFTLWVMRASVSSAFDQPEVNPGRFLHRLVRTKRAHRQGGQLGANHARKELVGSDASIRPARTVVRQDLETRRYNGNKMKSGISGKG